MFKKLVLFFFLCLPLSTFGATAPYTGGISATDLLAEYDNFAQQYKNFTPTKQDITLIQKLKGKEPYYLVLGAMIARAKFRV